MRRLSANVLVFLLTMLLHAAPVFSAFDCESWQRISPLITVADLNGVAIGDPGRVAVGEHGTMLFSTDEVGWRELPAPTESTLNAVTWADGLFVAVGSGGEILTSADGRQWDQVDLELSADLYAVTAGPDAWLAVGRSGTVVRSVDGVVWESVDSGSGSLLRAVVWHRSEFLAAGRDLRMLSSSDGLVWENHAVAELPDEVWGMASDGSTVVLVGDYANLISEDGRNWTEIDGIRRYQGGAVTFSGESFFLDTGGVVYRSDHGSSWERLGRVFPQADARAIAGSPHGLLAVGEDGAIGYLRDVGPELSLVSGLTTVPLEAVAEHDGTVVAVGGDGWPADAVILTSSDGALYSPAYEANNEKLLDVVATNHGFVAAGGVTELLCGPILMFSPDGSTWGRAQIDGNGSDIPCDYEALAAAGERVVVVGQGKSAVSLDGGSTWLASHVDESWSSTEAVATNGSTFVAVGSSGGSFTSGDGVNWERHEGSPGPGSYRSIAWGNGRFLTVGDDGGVLSSGDGIGWSDTGGLIAAEDLIWAGENFVAVGSGVVSISADGVEWTSISPDGVQALRGVAWDGHDLIAVGGTGLIARSTCGLTGSGAVAGFSWVPRTAFSGLPVRFWDLSVGEISSRYWSFADGGSSDLSNPVHVFARPGSYDVSLTVSGDGTSSTSESLTVVQGPISSSEELYLPGVAHLPGFNDTLWRTDVEICSMGNDRNTAVEIAFLLRDQANPSPETVSVSIAPWSCTRFPDAVDGLFETQAAGALRLSSDDPLIVSARIYNQSEGGSYGSFQTAAAPDDAIGPDELWILSHLSQSPDPDSGFRTNLGLLNLDDESVLVEVQLYTADGQNLGSISESLAAFEYTQVLQALLPLAPTGANDAFALVRSETPTARILAVASLVDNRSGDGATIQAQRIAP